MNVPFVVFLISLIPFPLCFLLNTQAWMQEPRIILVIGVLVLTLIIIVPSLLVSRMKKPDAILRVMGLFMFASMIDFIIALEADGILQEFMTFYLKEGEPYLWTPYGTMINYWDGIMHYGMCVWMLYCIAKGRSYRRVGLYWAGSITNSLLVLVPGSIIGKFGVNWAILLNLPYLFVPVWIGFRLLQTRQRAGNQSQKSQSATSCIWRRPVDIIFIIYFTYATILDLMRGFIALGSTHPLLVEYLEDHEPYIMDPVAYPKVQMIIYLMYFIPYYACAIYGLVNRGQSWMSDWALIYAGMAAQMIIYLMYFIPYYACAIYGLVNRGQSWMSDWALIYAGMAAQGQFSHIGGSIHSRTPAEFQVPLRSHSQNIFWLLNISLFVIPQLFALKENVQQSKRPKLQ